MENHSIESGEITAAQDLKVPAYVWLRSGSRGDIRTYFVVAVRRRRPGHLTLVDDSGVTIEVLAGQPLIYWGPVA